MNRQEEIREHTGRYMRIHKKRKHNTIPEETGHNIRQDRTPYTMTHHRRRDSAPYKTRQVDTTPYTERDDNKHEKMVLIVVI